MAIGNDDQSVPVKKMQNGVQIIGIVFLVRAIDVHLEALELDEYKVQAVDEADYIRAAQPQLAGHPQLAHCEITIVFGFIEIDQAQAFLDQPAGSVAAFHGNAIAQQLVLLLVLRDQRFGDIVLDYERLFQDCATNRHWAWQDHGTWAFIGGADESMR